MEPTALPLSGKVALVTGGAGGLGHAICVALAAEGASVVVGYNSAADAANALAARLKRGSVALFAPVTDTLALTALHDEIKTRFNRLDILINCAGTTRFVPHGDLDSLDDSLINTILATNVRGPFAAPHVGLRLR